MDIDCSVHRLLPKKRPLLQRMLLKMHLHLHPNALLDQNLRQQNKKKDSFGDSMQHKCQLNIPLQPNKHVVNTSTILKEQKASFAFDPSRSKMDSIPLTLILISDCKCRVCIYSQVIETRISSFYLYPIS